MIRFSLALWAVTAVAGAAGAQPGRLPLSPGVYPGSTIGPGTQYLPRSAPRFGPVPFQGRPYVSRPFGGYSFFPSPFYYGYGFGSGYGFGLPEPYYDPRPAPEPPPTPRPAEPTVVLANEFPATLIVQFPAPAEVWFNGQEQSGGPAEECTLASPVLKPGESFTFDIKARWTRAGKTYEAARSVTLGAGARSRLIVVSGTEVK